MQTTKSKKYLLEYTIGKKSKRIFLHLPNEMWLDSWLQAEGIIEQANVRKFELAK